MIGRLLDQRYLVVELLGMGGFGHTYIAQDTRRPGNPVCVVKHLKPATDDLEFLQVARRLFRREAETLEKLGNHDQIPRLLAYFEEQQEFFLVQEYIEGHQLATELPLGQRWDESQTIHLLQEVLPILEFLHDNEVIHRDIKPQNIIRRHSDNRLVLVDFGAVKQIQMYSLSIVMNLQLRLWKHSLRSPLPAPAQLWLLL
ncbi:protein kinase [Scytonema sp. UIC 10036]|uniref:protein kinase domain-containing protein n=1 Tax=Scytonema sp. UIC 10036 TaxID=2304196 RepID=UPI00325A60BC